MNSIVSDRIVNNPHFKISVNPFVREPYTDHYNGEPTHFTIPIDLSPIGNITATTYTLQGMNYPVVIQNNTEQKKQENQLHEEMNETLRFTGIEIHVELRLEFMSMTLDHFQLYTPRMAIDWNLCGAKGEEMCYVAQMKTPLHTSIERLPSNIRRLTKEKQIATLDMETEGSKHEIHWNFGFTKCVSHTQEVQTYLDQCTFEIGQNNRVFDALSFAHKFNNMMV